MKDWLQAISLLFLAGFLFVVVPLAGAIMAPLLGISASIMILFYFIKHSKSLD